MSIALRTITQAITDFEFHISPVPSSSRPQTAGRDLRDDVEHATSTILVGGQSPRTLYGFGNVRNISAAPKPDLVAKDPQSACPPTADAPSATTPRSRPLQSWTGACAMTYVEPGSFTWSAEW